MRDVYQAILSRVPRDRLPEMRSVCKLWDEIVTYSLIGRFRPAFLEGRRGLPMRELAVVCDWGVVEAEARDGDGDGSGDGGDGKGSEAHARAEAEAAVFAEVCGGGGVTGGRRRGCELYERYRPRGIEFRSGGIHPGRECGGALLRLCARSFPALRSLSFRQCHVVARDLRRLPSLTRLTSLDLHNNPVSSKGCKHISEAVSLRELNLSNCGIGDRGFLSVVGGLPALTRLNVNYNNLGAAALIHVSRLSSLRAFDGCWNNFDGPSLESLSGIRSLERVNISYVEIPRLDLLASSLAGVVELNLNNASLTDERARPIRVMTRLRVLDLSVNGLTDAFVGETLVALRELVALDVSLNALAYAGAKRISESLPGLRHLDISWNEVLDAGVYHLLTLPRLAYLDVVSCSLSRTMREALGAYRLARGVCVKYGDDSTSGLSGLLCHNAAVSLAGLA